MIERLATLRPWTRWLAVPPLAAERLEVTTADGLRLNMLRLRQSKAPPRGPVMLLHGLGSGALAFHFPGRSLASYLASRGFDCFVPELRGSGESERPAGSFDADDYLTLDLPAILHTILGESGAPRLHWIGHSMGGILLFCYGIRDPEASIASGIAIGSSLDYTRGRSVYARMNLIKPLARKLSVFPYGAFAHLVAPLCGLLTHGPGRMQVWPPNIEPAVARRLYAAGFNSIPMALLESLATTFEASGLRSRDGSVRYAEQASAFKLPVLLLGGSADLQCPPEAVRHTALQLGSRDRQVRLFGRAHGQADDYAHFDLIIGRRAACEVWPAIDAWLAAHSLDATPP
jgi:alpha-beta hydrolase superfamily lysophospholipase